MVLKLRLYDISILSTEVLWKSAFKSLDFYLYLLYSHASVAGRNYATILAMRQGTKEFWI